MFKNTSLSLFALGLLLSFNVPAHASDVRLRGGESVMINGDRISCEGGYAGPRGCRISNICKTTEDRNAECSGGDFVVNSEGYCLSDCLSWYGTHRASQELQRLARLGLCN